MNIPPGFAQANFVFGGVALPRGAQVTLGIDHSDSLGTPTAQATAIRNAWETHILPIQMSGVTLLEVRYKQGPNDTGPDAVVASGAVGQAVAAGDSPQVAALVRKITATGGRTGRGRMFLPGITESQTDTGGTLSAASLGTFETAFTGFHGFLTGVNLPPVLLHNSDELLPFPIVDFEVQSRLATQRRRLRKVGGRRRNLQLP